MIKTLQLIFSDRKYLSVSMCFLTLNILFGTWAIYIPAIKKKLAIDEGQLGFAVLFLGIGTFLMLIFAHKIIQKLHAGRSTALAIFLLILSFSLPFFATDYFWLCASLFVVGITSGLTDISMNTVVTEIEKTDEVHIMSANHGFFSLGGMISAGLGSLFMPMVENPLHHMLVVILLMIVFNLFFVSNYYHISSKEVEKNSFNFKYLKPLFVIILIGFFIMASEGAIVDWSALYLEKISLAENSLIGFGYTAFSFAMAFGRFLGDGISKKYGSKLLISFGSLIGILGFGLVLLVHPIVAIIGFGLVGLGFSVIVPELFRIGGKVPNVDASQGISLIAGSGFLGFLIGPVLLGFLAKTYSLKISMIALLGFTLISLLASFTLKNRNKV